MAATQWVYQYLKAIKNMKIVYYGSLTKYPCLEIYKNADWAGNKEIHKLILTYMAMLLDYLIS